RYAVGDIAVRSAKPCSCGRQPGFSVLRSVEGRVDGVWRSAEGRVIPMLDCIGKAQQLLDAVGCWESQFVQRGPRRIEVRVQPHRSLPDETLRTIAQLFDAPLGQGTDVVWLGREIEYTRQGKLLSFLRERADG